MCGMSITACSKFQVAWKIEVLKMKAAGSHETSVSTNRNGVIFQNTWNLQKRRRENLKPHTLPTYLSIYLSIRFYNSCRSLPETKRHSSPFLHWSGSKFPVMTACTPSIHVFLDVLFYFYILRIQYFWIKDTNKSRYDSRFTAGSTVYRQSLHVKRCLKDTNANPRLMFAEILKFIASLD
jgi:hypothetical protein